MEARRIHATLLVAAVLSTGAGYRTQNFVVDAPTEQLAREIGDRAEEFRRELAIEWTGKAMPPWAQPCMLTANVSPELGAGGATSFVFEHGEVFGWRMNIQGSRQRILDSVLPHEVTHTIFACHFRKALPRWADEGACTTVEHPSERQKQERMLITFLKTGRGISFSRMFVMKEYPQDVMPLYSQGYSLARFLIAQGGKRKFLEFVGSGMQDENWPRALKEHYQFDNLLALQNTWLDWVRRGSPPLPAQKGATLVAASGKSTRATPAVYRGQSPDQRSEAQADLVPVEQPTNTAARQTTAAGQWQPAGTARLRTKTPQRETTPPADYGPSAYQQTARPQPVQKSRQIILQGSPPPRGYPMHSATVRGPIYDSSRPPGTVQR